MRIVPAPRFPDPVLPVPVHRWLCEAETTVCTYRKQGVRVKVKVNKTTKPQINRNSMDGVVKCVTVERGVAKNTETVCEMDRMWVLCVEV